MAMLVVSFLFATPSRAIPLEKFDHKMEVACEGPGACVRSLRSKTALGSYTGIAWRGVGEGKGTLSVNQGLMGLVASGSSVGALTLTWDGDTSAEQLSGAGLGCLDVRNGGATGLVVSGLSIQGRCSTEEDFECPPFVIETRLYDFADPTGQTYSASMLRRPNNKSASDVVIPFSNLTRSGPRGLGRLECVGAISVTVRMDRYSQVTLSMGPIFTNSHDPLAVPPTPTPTVVAVVTSPSVDVSGGASEVVPTPVPTKIATIAPVESAKQDSQTPTIAPTKVVASPIPALEKAIVAPRDKAEVPADPTPREEEVVYGQVVSE